MKTCIYPGTFDPITNGHLDVFERACRMFDNVIVGVAENPGKNPFFTVEERLELVKENISGFKNASAISFSGLLINFAKDQKADVVIRGLRAASDFEFEFQMALMNRHLGPEIETILVMTKEGYNYTSSNLMKQVSAYGADVSRFVPENVNKALIARLGNKHK